MTDQPRLFHDPQEVSKREMEIDLPHVAPLNNWVRKLRQKFDNDANIPWFDPWDGGIEAKILWLLEAPGPKATKKRGSGFISCNNDDQTAKNTWETREEAGVPRKMVVHWNVIPYYIGSDTKIRAYNNTDVASVRPYLKELLGFFPNLKAVILGGTAARTVWYDLSTKNTSLHVIECPLPSPTNLNTRPGYREKVVSAWREAKKYL